MARVSNRKEHGFSIPKNPVTGPVPGNPTEFSIDSKVLPPPVDDEGLSMLNNHEVGEIFGWNKHNSKRISYNKPIRQYKVYPTKEKIENSENTGQGARTWFSLSDVVHHLGQAAKEDPTKKGAHAFHLNRLKQARKTESNRIKKGGTVYSLQNQPHPGYKNKGFFGPDTREWTEERVGMTKGSHTPVTTGQTTSNLDNPYKYGKFTSVEDRGNPS
jgi:hypothetical protein